MELLDSLIESGRIVPVSGAFVALEIAAPVICRRRTERGVPSLTLLLDIEAGGR